LLITVLVTLVKLAKKKNHSAKVFGGGWVQIRYVFLKPIYCSTAVYLYRPITSFHLIIFSFALSLHLCDFNPPMSRSE
jgi:hypothetical protein